MNVRIDTIIHKAKCFTDGEALTDLPCTPDAPGPCHLIKLIWYLQTWCNQKVSVKGRPKPGAVTCIECLAQVP